MTSGIIKDNHEFRKFLESRGKSELSVKPGGLDPPSNKTDAVRQIRQAQASKAAVVKTKVTYRLADADDYRVMFSKDKDGLVNRIKILLKENVRTTQKIELKWDRLSEFVPITDRKFRPRS